jgi:hypothetical protein
MGDVAQILGAKPGAAISGGEEPIFKLRAAAPEKKGAGTKIAVGGAQKKKKLSRELSALVGDNAEEVLPPVVSEDMRSIGFTVTSPVSLQAVDLSLPTLCCFEPLLPAGAITLFANLRRLESSTRSEQIEAMGVEGVFFFGSA